MPEEDMPGGGADDGSASGSDGWADARPGQAPPETARHTGPPAPGMVINDRYELLTPIGHGGMGEVWRALDTKLRRFVALKGLLDRTAMTGTSQAEAMARARREAQAIAKIEHQNVVTVHDQVETDRQVWIVMKLLDARSLADLLRSEETLTVPRAARIALQILQGLRAVHAADVVHRDVKPHNVVVGDGGQAILVDFGIATFDGALAVTQAGAVIGTPEYLAPELFDSSAPASRTATPASDLWALGVTLYEMVEGHTPFRGLNQWEVQVAIDTSPVPPFQYAGPLAPVIEGLLARDPQRRLSASAAEAMLQQVLDPRPTTGVTTPAPVPEPEPEPVHEPHPTRSPRSPRSAPLKAGALALGVVLLAGAGWFTLSGEEPDEKGGERAGTGQGSTKERWKDTHPLLKIGVKDDQPGLSKFDEKTRTYAGYDIDLAYEIAERMGYARDEVDFTTVATDYRSTALKVKLVDLVIASYSITPERKTAPPTGYSVDFAGPYYEASRGFLVRENSSRYEINDTSDLETLKVEVCTARDSTYESWLPKAGFKLVKSPPNTYQDCLDKLLDKSSDVYAVATDDVILAGYVKDNPGKVRQLENVGGAEGYGVGMRPKSPLLKGEVCTSLKDILAGQVWQDLYRKNLSPLTGRENPPGLPDLTECKGY
ncbi:serine/threonine-protein kinase [Streptomyces sp. NPDC058620]|uniref:serine/threonine-protein kinase n=1 Tax=Streptomyces sp. NPDC058620 TaxID=3346560 RepID=UPI0036468298